MDACDRRFPARRKLCRSQPLGADGPRCHCLAACKRVDAPGGRLFQLSLADAERALPPVQGRGRYDGGQCEIGRASCRERVGQSVSILVVAVYLNKKTKKSTI